MDLLRWNEGIVRINGALEKLRQPVIAAINGAAMGGGLELAISCTLRVVSESAKMAMPEVKLGIIPGTGGTQRLPRLIGKGRAAELLLTGEPIDAQEAYRIGLVGAEDHGKCPYCGRDGQRCPRNRQRSALGACGSIFPEKLCCLLYYRGYERGVWCISGKAQGQF
jgi:hypothetical protein